MKDEINKLAAASRFLQSLEKPRGTWFQRFESFLTGGFFWRTMARRTEGKIHRETSYIVEEPDSCHTKLQDQLLIEQDLADYGVPVDEALRDRIDKLHASGHPPPRVKAWFATRQISRDGIFSSSTRRTRLVWTLGWTWHLIVLATAILFLILTWALPGPIWKKAMLTGVEVLFFLIMAALMNARSLSALPPKTPKQN